MKYIEKIDQKELLELIKGLGILKNKTGVSSYSSNFKMTDKCAYFEQSDMLSQQYSNYFPQIVKIFDFDIQCDEKRYGIMFPCYDKKERNTINEKFRNEMIVKFGDDYKKDLEEYLQQK